MGPLLKRLRGFLQFAGDIHIVSGRDVKAFPLTYPVAQFKGFLKVLGRKAGFDEKAFWGRNLTAYVRFGSKQTADNYLRGDRFDKIEIDKREEST